MQDVPFRPSHQEGETLTVELPPDLAHTVSPQVRAVQASSVRGQGRAMGKRGRAAMPMRMADDCPQNALERYATSDLRLERQKAAAARDGRARYALDHGAGKSVREAAARSIQCLRDAFTDFLKESDRP